VTAKNKKEDDEEDDAADYMVSREGCGGGGRSRWS
jgi:hypothetical protein